MSSRKLLYKQQSVLRCGPAEVRAFTRRASRYNAERIEGGVRAKVVTLDVQHAERGVAQLSMGWA